MKSIILILLLTIGQFVLAQPILNHSNLVPVVGDAFVQYETDTATQPGLGGANVTWTFNNLSLGAMHIINYIDNASSPYPNAFPGATYVEEIGSNYGYYLVEPNNLLNLGSISGSDTINWMPPISVLCYPITYLTACPRSYYSGNYLGDSISGYGDVICDGFGTIVINGQSFSNCLRIKSERHEIVYSTMVGQYNVEHIIYNWVNDTHKFPLLSIVTTNTSGPFSFSIKNVSISSFVTGINNSNKKLQVISLFPNPAQVSTFLSLPQCNNEDLIVRIFDQKGLEVLKKTIVDNINSHYIKLDLNEFIPGFYFVEISGKHYNVLKKLIIY